jgi:hypothetical protein
VTLRELIERILIYESVWGVNEPDARARVKKNAVTAEAPRLRG